MEKTIEQLKDEYKHWCDMQQVGTEIPTFDEWRYKFKKWELHK